jgi:ElaB/YqjD/DUF883 family membrane-anchored ribosome-binding protein
MAQTTATPVTDAVKERVMPTLEQFERKARSVRRAVVRGRYAAEDFAAAAHLAVRHRPMRALVVAGAAGAVAGCVLGYRLARRAARRNEGERE